MLSRILDAVAFGRRPTVVQLFRRASRYRDEGRFEEAAELVQDGLNQDPENAVGHLLAGSLHTVFRDMERARAEFARVLALDPTHPRALLGMARIALEEGERAACSGYLEQALSRYPDFPEAQALLDVVTSLGPDDAPSLPQAAAHINVDRLRAPAECRELLLARTDGLLVLAQPFGARSEESAARMARVGRLAAAMLARAGLGPLDHAVIEGTAETALVRTDGAMLLSLSLPREADVGPAVGHLQRVWANCVAELERQVA